MSLHQPQNAAATAAGLGGEGAGGAVLAPAASGFPFLALSLVSMSHGHPGTSQPSLGHRGCCQDNADTPEMPYPALGDLAGFGYHGHPWDTTAIPGTPQLLPGHCSHPWDIMAIPGTPCRPWLSLTLPRPGRRWSLAPRVLSRGALGAVFPWVSSHLAASRVPPSSANARSVVSLVGRGGGCPCGRQRGPCHGWLLPAPWPC